MALTSTVNDYGISGRWRRHVTQVTFDSSYPTGGEAYTAELFGLGSLEHVEILSPSNGGYVIEDDSTNSKLLAYEAGADGAALDEVADTTDLSAVVIRVAGVGT